MLVIINLNNGPAHIVSQLIGNQEATLEMLPGLFRRPTDGYGNDVKDGPTQDAPSA